MDRSLQVKMFDIDPFGRFFNLQHANTPLILSKMSCKCRHSVGLFFALLVVILVSLASEGMSIGFSSIYSHKIAETGLLT